jgi:hypothetical protein
MILRLWVEGSTSLILVAISPRRINSIDGDLKGALGLLNSPKNRPGQLFRTTIGNVGKTPPYPSGKLGMWGDAQLLKPSFNQKASIQHEP